MGPLQTTCLVRVSHQHSLQDMCCSPTIHRQAPLSDKGFEAPSTCKGMLALLGTRTFGPKLHRRWPRAACAHGALPSRLVVTVAILAQGTSWAVAVTQAFFLEGVRFPPTTDLLLRMVAQKNCLHFSICACHPCAGAMLIFSVSFQF